MGKQAQAVVRPTVTWQRGLGEGLREGREAPVPTADANWGGWGHVGVQHRSCGGCGSQGCHR